MESGGFFRYNPNSKRTNYIAKWFRKLPRVVAVTFANTLSLYKKSEFSICNELKYNQDKFVETWNKHHENEPPIAPDEVKV